MIGFISGLHESFVRVVLALRDLPPLFFRLALAYGFYEPAVQKWSNIEVIAKWFADMEIPAPLINAYMAAGTEAAGVVLLTLGLATRLISIPLMVVMVVAVKTVHWKCGFAACSCAIADKGSGYEIPFYFFLMLFSLLVRGPGRISIDHLLGSLPGGFGKRRPSDKGIEAYSRSW